MSTREKIVDLADKLIRSKGYAGFSYGDISASLGGKNAAIHYHFKSKEDLGNEVINHNLAKIEKQFANLDSSPSKALIQFVKIYSSSRKQNLICFLAALGAAFNLLPHTMKNNLKIASDKIRKIIIAILENGKMKNEFSFDSPAREKADLIIAALMSSLILDRISADDYHNNIINQLGLNVFKENDEFAN